MFPHILKRTSDKGVLFLKLYEAGTLFKVTNAKVAEMEEG